MVLLSIMSHIVSSQGYLSNRKRWRWLANTNCRSRSVHLVLETGLLHQTLDICDLLREGNAVVTDLDHFTLVSLINWL